MSPPKDKIIEPIPDTMDNVVAAVLEPANAAGSETTKHLSSPFAKWRGKIDLGGDEIDCYVLDTKQRVLSSGSVSKSIANVERGSLQDYAGQKALNPFIDIDKILQETVRFAIPGTQFEGVGITTEHFELICRGYVRALYEKAPLTDRQREIAIKCAVLTAGLTRTGLDALIDEATGYQYERAEDALQVKLRAFIADELRDWEKTFPDPLWEEFGRLTKPGCSPKQGIISYTLFSTINSFIP